MKKAFKLSTALLLVLSLSFIEASSQCEPDTVNCMDIMAPGQICPDTLDDGYLNEPYSSVVTIIPPGKMYSELLLDSVTIVKIVVAEVANLPPGLTYEANADEFYADSAYCILLNGTPVEAGVFDLEIKVIPYIFFLLNVIEADTVVDDTSLSITVLEATDAEPVSGSGLTLVQCFPNPYRISTSIELATSSAGFADLQLYNLAGQKVYSEILHTQSGLKRFRFTGEDLPGGIYLYKVRLGNLTETGKLVRLKE